VANFFSRPYLSFLQGGGQSGAQLIANDWSKSPIGEVDHWPQSLKTTISIVLKSGMTMFLIWGQEHIFSATML